MNMVIVFKLIFLFASIWMTSVNISRTYGQQKVPAVNFIYQSIGMTGFIYLQWLM